MDLPGANNEPVESRAIALLLHAAPQVPVALLARDDGRLLDGNQGMADLLAAPLQELPGRAFLERDVAAEHRVALRRCLDAGSVAGLEVELQSAAGKRAWITIDASAIVHRGIPALLAICQDVTEYKRAVQELAQVKDRLARQTNELATNELKIKQRAADAANRAKSTFLANMSHELRSPLNSILGFSEMIRDLHFGSDRYDKYVQYAGFIHQAGTHLLALIDDILDLAKVESGKLKLNPTTFDLAALLEECADMVRPLADRRSLTLAVAVAPGLKLTADRLRAKQMVLNLLSNAIKFTLAQGRVELAARATADGGTEIAVADTGVGMTAEEVTLALQPFGRSERAAVTDPTGTGLGVPIVKNLIEAHGGRLQIESAPGRGTTARLHFPPPPPA